MRQRDARYAIIKPMLNTGEIISFLDIFKYIPKSVVAADLGKKVDRFTELMNRIEEFTVGELVIIGSRCNLTIAEMFKLVENEYVRRISNLRSDASS